ncbi:MAG: hypothetical protein E5V25_16395 [Mesorhizobium sp.]|nr:MAG: hypothetical protein E5V25_16395 [Mesorhizobium sp.]
MPELLTGSGLAGCLGSGKAVALSLRDGSTSQLRVGLSDRFLVAAKVEGFPEFRIIQAPSRHGANRGFQRIGNLG